MSNEAVILLGALALDGLIGDPGWLWSKITHPAVWFGRMTSAFERRWNNGAVSSGILTILFIAVLAGLAGFVIERLLPSGWPGGIAVAVIASIFIAQRGLYEHVRDVARADGLDAAKQAVSQIVGRDPQKLDEAGVARAAIESCAENFSDGVIAPAFWFLIGGLPGLFVYKAVNTADSMIGYRSERYEKFGKAAARLDDVMNYIPARISGLLIALASGQVKAAIKIMWRDAGKHSSPNAGWPESAMAGAMGLALGGPRSYGGGAAAGEWLNETGRKAGMADIDAALRIFIRTCFLNAAFIAVIALF